MGDNGNDISMWPGMPGEKTRVYSKTQKAAFFCLLAVFCAGFFDILGGALNIQVFKSIVPGWQPMSVVTAFCLILFSIQLGILLLYEKQSNSLTAMKIPAILAFSIGVLIFILYQVQLHGADGIHAALPPFMDYMWRLASGVNIYTAVLIILFSISMLLLSSGAAWKENLAHIISMPAIVAAYVVVLSYILRVDGIHAFFKVRMAFNTGIAFCLVGMAVFLLNSNTKFMASFTGNNFGSVMTRRMLPWLMILPVVIGWVRLQGERTGFFPSEVGVVFVGMAYTLCFLAILYLNARAVNRSDIQAKENIQAVNEELTTMNEELTSMNEELNASVEIKIKAEEAMSRSMKRFEMLSDTASSLLRSRSPQEAINSLCIKVMRQLDCHLFLNYMVTDTPGRLRLNAFSGISGEEAKRIGLLENGSAICIRVAGEGYSVMAEKIQQSDEERTELVRSYGMRAYACNPILDGDGKVSGTLSFGTRNRDSFDADDTALMKAVTDMIAEAMIRMKNEVDIKRSRDVLEERVKERTAQLADERKRLFDVMETLPVYIAILSADHRLTYANKYFRDRFSVDSSRRCHQAMFNSEQPCKNCVIHDVLNGKKQHNWTWTTPGGCNYDIYDFSFREADGTDKILEMGIDITESTRAHEALLESQMQMERLSRLSEIGTLASTVAHELRNPLAAISITVYNIKRKTKNKKVSENLTNIQKKVKESSQIISNLLFYSRLRPPSLEKVVLHDILEETVHDLAARINKEIKINLNFDRLKDVIIDADATQLKEVFNNLLNNALEAVSPISGNIEIRGLLNDGKVQITVQDNGQGIENDSLEKVFDPFFTTKSKGTGLGLSVCRQIINNHGGSNWLESGTGNGTAAHVLIPGNRDLQNY
jgi:nitrogen-specific signal transduction histidine kinase/putative methionine-R-sulfoxide reductase with GAF domain